MTEIILNKNEKLDNILNSATVRMEGVKEAAQLFGISKHLARTLALEGKVKAVRVSNSPNAKILINIQSLNDYFNSSFINTTNEQAVHNNATIQPIPVKL